MRLHVDSWRWQGVPFVVRAGKSLATTATEVFVEFRGAPPVVFPEPPPPMGNYIRFRLSPHVAIALGARAKRPGEGMTGQPVELLVSDQAAEDGADRLDAYERLLGDAMQGDATLFARQDVVEAAWAIVAARARRARAAAGIHAGQLGPARGRSPRAGRRWLEHAGVRVSGPGSWVLGLEVLGLEVVWGLSSLFTFLFSLFTLT